MARSKVLIVGASIAGPTTAYWLARANCKVTIIERFPALRPGGQSIDIRMNAVHIMQKMGPMEKMVRAKYPDFEGFSLVDTNNKSYGTLRSTGDASQQALISEYEIFRGDLAKVLYDLTVDNEHINYVFDEQVAAIDQRDDTAFVTFKNGKLENQEYDLVIAADGATSRTRALGLQCGVRDHTVPLNSWAAYWSRKEDLSKGSKIGTAYSAVGGRFMALGPDSKGGSTCIYMKWNSREDKNAIEGFRAAQMNGEDAMKDFVAESLRGQGWRTAELIEGLASANDFYATEIMQVKAPMLHSGRFVMVGDAGYAAGPTGTGTSLAMIGSYVLAGEIQKHQGDIQAGLKGYEEIMVPIVKELQKIPPVIPTIMAPQTWWGLMIRNYMFMLLVGSGLINMVQRMFGGAAMGATDTGLVPEYEWPSDDK